jgi:putative nucleotidyltransferase with HDIG domain
MRLLVNPPWAFLNFVRMEIDCTDKEQQILQTIATAARQLSLPSYVIGGFVRDKIMGRPTKDIDVVCIGDGIELAHATASLMHPKPHVNFFKNFGTAQFLMDDVDIEFVGARKESYTYDSRKPVVEPGNLANDQDRRDFTINAMAISLSEVDFGKIIDPFNGRQDIANKIIRTPVAPGLTFSDDPLRMMRAIRFAAQLHFTIEQETLSSITEHASRIKIVSGERISEELNKIILTDKPSVGFALLYTTGLLQFIFPQMTALAGAENIDGMGHKDNFYHTLQVLDNISVKTNDLWLRWAAILHDIAKPNTKRFEEGHGFTFHGHEVVGGKMVPTIFAQLKLPQNEKMRLVRKLVELHLRPISLTKDTITDSAIRRLLFDAGEDFESLMMLCEADITSKNKFKVKRYLENFDMVRKRCAEVDEKDHIRNWQPPISGEMIMQEFKLPPGRMVGVLKNAIREAILDGLIANDYDSAHSFMLEKARELGVGVGSV